MDVHSTSGHLRGAETRDLIDNVKMTPGADHVKQGRPRSALSSKGPAGVFKSRLKTQSLLGK